MRNVAQIKEIQNIVSSNKHDGELITEAMMDACKHIGGLDKQMGTEGFIEVMASMIPVISTLDRFLKESNESDDDGYKVDPSEIPWLYPGKADDWIYNITQIMIAATKAIGEVERYDKFLKRNGIEIDFWR